MSENGPIVSLETARKTYLLGSTEIHAVDGVTLSIAQGDFVSIVGPSGSGKTTILNLIGCLDTPTAGLVRIDGTATSGLKDDQITALRLRTLGFIFQSFNLIPVLSVRENVEFPILIGARKLSREQREWVDHLIDEVGLAERRDHKPNELSGGQRQRVAIARALATRPRVVLADEPTANLDSKTGEAIIELMRKINHESDTTFIFSTHDSRIVSNADHVIKLLDGRIEDEQKPSANGAGRRRPA